MLIRRPNLFLNYFEDFMSDFSTFERKASLRSPTTDIYEKDNKTYIEMEVPGFDVDDISITIDNGVLNIKAHQENSKEDESKQYQRLERKSKSFSQSLVLSSDIDQENIEANCDNGILTVVLTKKEVPEPKKIPIAKSLKLIE